MNDQAMSDDMNTEHAAEGVHPFAKPFLFLGKEGVKRNRLLSEAFEFR